MVARGAFDQHLPKPDMAMPNVAALLPLGREHLATGAITPIADKAFPLSDAPAAIRYLTGGQARGRIVITV
jgi:NADPH:quinone reductase-like Zn-dependent oxidoreductase